MSWIDARRKGIQGHVAKRAAWGIADQALSSLSNFSLSILVARAASPTIFGAFAVAISLYAIYLQFVRGLVGLPISIRLTTSTRAEWAVGVARASAAAVAIATILGFSTAAAGLVISKNLGLAFILLGVGMPALMLQDSWRYAFFSRGQGHLAFLNDAIWTISFLAILAVAELAIHPPAIWIMAAWCAGATAAAVFGSFQASIWPQIREASRWLRDTRDIGVRFAIETLAVTGTGQGAFFLIGVVLGLSSLGSVRGAYTLLGPLNILFFGIMIMGVPEAAKTIQNSPARLGRRAASASVILALLALALGLPLLAIPDALGSALLGHLWYSSRAFILPMTIFMSFTGIQIGALIALRGLGAAKMSLRAALISSPITLVVTFVGALAYSANGAAWGLCIGRASAAAIAWMALRHSMRALVSPTSDSATAVSWPA